MSDPASEKWHMDRRIPLALIVTIGIQTAGVFFWMGQLSVRIDQLERQITMASQNDSRLTRLEVQIDNATKLLTNIERKMENIR